MNHQLKVEPWRVCVDTDTTLNVGMLNFDYDIRVLKQISCSSIVFFVIADTSTVNGHLFNATLAIVSQDISVKDTAKLFAKITVAQYDSSIAAWYQKYKYLFWRPITALRYRVLFSFYQYILSSTLQLVHLMCWVWCPNHFHYDLYSIQITHAKMRWNLLSIANQTHWK